MADRRWLTLAVAVCLAGCAVAREPTGPALADEVHLRLVETLLVGRRYFAALAQLDSLPEKQRETPEARLLRAELLRRLGRAGEAIELYQGLREGDTAGPAARGLGLIAAARGDVAQAVSELREAARLRPSDPRIRNDLGYALLLAGEPDEAEHELATALDLAPDSQRSAKNLVLALLLRGDERKARELAARTGLGKVQWNAIRERARELAKAGGGAGKEGP